MTPCSWPAWIRLAFDVALLLFCYLSFRQMRRARNLEIANEALLKQLDQMVVKCVELEQSVRAYQVFKASPEKPS